MRSRHGRQRGILTGGLRECRALPEKIGGGDAELATEMARKVRLIEKAEVYRNVRELSVGAQNQSPTGLLQSLFEDEPVR